jgi:hypothetical protein
MCSHEADQRDQLHFVRFIDKRAMEHLQARRMRSQLVSPFFPYPSTLYRLLKHVAKVRLFFVASTYIIISAPVDI